MDPKEQIAALGVLTDPNASDEDKAAALDALTAHLNSLLSSSEESSSENEEGAPAEGDKPEQDSDSEDEEPSKEMASALAKLAELTERITKIEKASAAGRAPRAAKPTVIPRVEPVRPDPVTQMIDNAVAASRRNAGKAR